MSELKRAGSAVLDQLPTERLAEQGQLLLALLAERAIEKALGPVEELAERLIDYAQHGGPGLIAAITGGAGPVAAKQPISATVKAGITGVSESVKQTFSGVSDPTRSGRVVKAINIVEQIDVDVPVRVAYDQWSQFQEFSQFMKKVSSVEKNSVETSSWKVQVLWSNRAWDARIIEQIPDERIAWRSDGEKCRVDGAVSFHAVAPKMTRILLVLEYRPWGLLERTGNLWHAQARRVRLEIEQFRRHVVTRAALDPASVPGWRGEIRDGKVVRTHEEAVAAEVGGRGENQDRAQAPDSSAADDLDPVARDGADDVDDPAGEPDGGYHNPDDDPDDDYDDDFSGDYEDDDPDGDPDGAYADEPERVAARSGGGNR